MQFFQYEPIAASFAFFISLTHKPIRYKLKKHVVLRIWMRGHRMVGTDWPTELCQFCIATWIVLQIRSLQISSECLSLDNPKMEMFKKKFWPRLMKRKTSCSSIAKTRTEIWLWNTLQPTSGQHLSVQLQVWLLRSSKANCSYMQLINYFCYVDAILNYLHSCTRYLPTIGHFS